MTRRRVATIALSLLLALLTVGSASAHQGSSLFDNIGPEPVGGGMAERYPSSHYGLDRHPGDVVTTSDVPILPDAVSADFDIEAAGASILHLLASMGWDTIRQINNLVITIFTFAFSLDLITGATGALRPVSNAVNHLYDALGTEWLTLAVMILGAIATWRVLLKGEIISTVGTVLVSLACLTIALAIITMPGWVIGGSTKLSNEASVAILGAVNGDDDTSGVTTTAQVKNALFETWTHDVWIVLNFGGLTHCVNDSNQPVKPYADDCENTINNKRKYAQRWLAAGPANGEARDLEYEALRDGKAPDADRLDDANLPANTFDGYSLSAADRPAVDVQQGPSAGERLGAVALIGFGMLGAWILVGGLAVGMILAQVVALLLFAFTPLVMLAAVSGTQAGVGMFRGWCVKLIFAITRKVWYSLILAVVLMLAGAMTAATGDTGWALAFGLTSLFYWAVFLYRKEIYGLMKAALGAQEDGGQRRSRAQTAYYQARMMRPAAAAVTGAITGAGYMAMRGAARTGSAAAGAADKAARGTGRATRGAGQRLGDVADQSVAGGHTSRMVQSAALQGTAIDELEQEHSINVSRLSDETARRARIAELERRQQVSRSNFPEAESVALTDSEDRELQRERGRLMGSREYEGLRDGVADVEERRRRTGAPFTSEQVAERAQRIAESDRTTVDYSATTRTGRRGERDRPDDMAEVARRARAAAARDSTRTGPPADPEFDVQVDAAAERAMSRARRRRLARNRDGRDGR